MNNFENELANLINRYSKENGSNTPDYILAEYLSNCLNAFNVAVQTRSDWHGNKETFIRDGAVPTDPLGAI